MKSKEWVEIEAPTVDEALILGLTQLGITREEADIKVLDEGSSGFLGLGARESRVRVGYKNVSVSVEESAEEPVVVQPAAVKVEPSPAEEPPDTQREAEPVVLNEPAESKGVSMPVEPTKIAQDALPEVQETEASVQSSQPVVVETKETQEQSHIKAVVLEVAENLFRAFEVQPEVTWYAGDGRDRPELWLSLQGKDAVMLIEQDDSVLNAVQFLTRILVRSKVDGNFNLILDADGRRWQRTHKLEQLAKQTAEKAVRLGRPVRLQPMSARARRYVHMVLRQDSRVRTKSYGSGKGRAVTVFPTQESE
ncbi:MAG: Jag N-terminal domain-containing protein [Chloroflexota bacterium]|nr:Jag N-terminal domain-containing protein [Chloroflexota bacterium]